MATRQQIQRIRVLAKMAIFRNMQDSPDSPTFAKPFTEDSPDSRKVSLVSVTRVWQMWRIWGVWQMQGRPFYTYKICFWCIKWPTLSCTHVLARLTDIRQTVYRGLARLADIRQTVNRVLARLANICLAVYRVYCQTRRHLPNYFSKNQLQVEHDNFFGIT